MVHQTVIQFIRTRNVGTYVPLHACHRVGITCGSLTAIQDLKIIYSKIHFILFNSVTPADSQETWKVLKALLYSPFCKHKHTHTHTHTRTNTHTPHTHTHTPHTHAQTHTTHTYKHTHTTHTHTHTPHTHTHTHKHTHHTHTHTHTHHTHMNAHKLTLTYVHAHAHSLSCSTRPVQQSSISICPYLAVRRTGISGPIWAAICLLPMLATHCIASVLKTEFGL